MGILTDPDSIIGEKIRTVIFTSEESEEQCDADVSGFGFFPDGGDRCPRTAVWVWTFSGCSCTDLPKKVHACDMCHYLHLKDDKFDWKCKRCGPLTVTHRRLK